MARATSPNCNDLGCAFYPPKGPAHGGKVCLALDATYDILIMDAYGQHLQLESFKDLNVRRQRLPVLATPYPGTKVPLWNRYTRAILAETDDY